MLVMAEEGTAGGICQSIYRYAKDNYDYERLGYKKLMWFGNVAKASRK